MRSSTFQAVLTVIICAVIISTTSADTLIYDNSNLSGYIYNPGSYTEFIDYGTSPGGRVSKFVFDYVAESTTGTIWIGFYRYTDYYDPGYLIKQFALTAVPSTAGGLGTYEYVIPEEDRFELLSGDFGYSFEFSRSTTYAIPASGGSGNEDYFWVYDDVYWDDFVLTYFSNTWSGFSMQVYTAPPIADVTCDISGYKFNDTDGNGTWDGGESALPGWEMYIDENQDGAYQVSEPNVVTDPNGIYFFENLEFDNPGDANEIKTFVVREIMQDGWTQTLPGSGSDYEHIINAEPNNLYGPYNFGNTEQVISTDIKLYGYIATVDGMPISDARVETNPGSTSSGFDDTDEQGYYEITVSAPFTGSVSVTKTGWSQIVWSMGHTNLITDYQQDFEMLYLYGGGDGSESDPFQIHTAEQMNFIGRQDFWHLDKHFVLMNDIDLSVYEGADYNVIGQSISDPFEGTFDGNGFSISNFIKQTPDSIMYASLFGVVDGPDAVIENIRIITPQINTPNSSVAAPIISLLEQGTVTNCYVIEGSVIAGMYAGGLIGQADGTVTNCHVIEGSVTAEMYAGGLIGKGDGIVENCSASCDVAANSTSSTYAGGLIGLHRGQVRRSFAVGDVSGYNNVGGFVGRASGTFGSGSVQDCYAWGTAAGPESSVGGLVGYNEITEIRNCYSIGYSEYIFGGLCGDSIGGTFPGCFWDKTTSSQFSISGTGLTTEQMQMMASYTGWDFDAVWRICNGMNYPRLQWEPKPIGDFVCPDGVELNDFMVLCEEWLGDKMSADIVPDGGDGFVNLQDWQRLANAWLSIPGQANWDETCDLYPEAGTDIIDELDLDIFTEQWLSRSVHYADIAPEGAPDGEVNLLDYSLFAENWMVGVD